MRLIELGSLAKNNEFDAQNSIHIVHVGIWRSSSKLKEAGQILAELNGVWRSSKNLS